MKSLIIQLFFAILLLPQLLWAQTFVVTSSSSCGSGSFAEAIQYANSTPGKDRIEFDPGLREIQVRSCTPISPEPTDFFLARATESVDIVGVDDLDPSTSAKEHLKFKGYNQWIDKSGRINPHHCPTGSDIIVAQTPGLIAVGIYGVDNSGIDVTLKNIDVDGLNTLAYVNKAASLSVSNGSFTNLLSSFRSCQLPTIELKDKASLSLYKTTFEDNKVMDSFDTYYMWYGVIGASDATVEIQDSTFYNNLTGGLIFQNGGKLTIVNTKIDMSEGIGAFDTVVHIVNTGIYDPYYRLTNRSTQQGVHAIGGSITLDAVSIDSGAWYSSTPPYDIFGFTTHSVQFSATGNASATIADTAIGAQLPSGSTLPFSYTTGASWVLVVNSWVRDGSLPGADATLPGISDTAINFFEEMTPVAGGALIDKSADILVNPLTGTAITTDVLGNPRWSGPLRDIGAIELPQLYVADKSYSTVTDTALNKTAASGLLALSTTPAGTSPLSVTANTTPAHGSVTVNPDGSFVYNPNAGYYGTDTFSFTGTNTSSQSKDGVVNITVTPPAGTPPTATNDAYMDTIPTTCIAVAAPGVLSNDEDPFNALGTPPKQPNDGLTARKVTDPANATLTFNADGSFSLCPDDPSLVWEYSFTYDVITTDSRVSSPATVTIQHRLNTNKPIATQDSYTSTGDTTWTIPTLGVLTNDVDPNNQFQVPPALPNQDMVSVLVTGVSHGTLQLNSDGSFEYTPKNGFSGTDSFTYKAVASKGLGQESNPTTVTLTVQAGPTQLPGQPTLSATAGPNSAALSWTTPSPGTSPITGYLVHYRQAGMTVWINWPHTGTATATTVTGLTSGRTYAFQVAAVSSVGSGAFSSTATATIPGLPTVTTQAVTAIGATTATGNGNITDLGTPPPTQHGVCWNTTGTPTTADSKTEQGPVSATGAFTSNMTGLSLNTTYYVRAYATDAAGTSYGNQVSFATGAQVPTVTTQAVTAVGTTSADGHGNITDLGSPNPTQHGVCWNTTGTPTTANSKTEKGAVSATGAFASHMTGLSAGTTYYVRAYATNASGTSYGNQVSFATRASAATVTTQAVSVIGTTTATGNGNITDLGAPPPTQHGVCWNTTGTPTIGDGKTEEGPASATGAFTSNMTGLSPNITYYVRAYVTDAVGTIYGNQVSFAIGGQLPTVTTQAVTGIGTTTADGNGNITDLGSPNPTQHGVCWNTTGTPTITDCKTEKGAVSATGAFASHLTGLSANTTYYVRAYATNTAGTSYGTEVSFATRASAATVTTQAVTGIGTTTATGNGNITDLGAPPPTQHGVCWNTTGTPTIGDGKTEEGPASATGAFTSNMTGLSPNITYYVRAYVTDAVGTIYGNQVSFAIGGQLPTVTTQAVTGIGTTTADGNGNITDLGVPNPTQHGVCWNTTGTPTTGENKTEKGTVSATGAFASHMTGLSANATYYVRAYATNTAGTSYGSQVSFATRASAATVTTQAVTGIGTTSATGHGNITDLGAPPPTQHGVCWNTTGTPTTGDNKTEDGPASATGGFTSNMTGLSANTTYYVRAYITDTVGTIYGNQISFTTSAGAPTVTTQAVSGIGKTTASGNGNITDLGLSNPTQHGVCWNTTGTPTTADNKTEEGVASATGAFTSNMTGLHPGTDYYVRAYATNTSGTSYGGQVFFISAGRLATGNPSSYKVTVTKVEMYNGTLWVTIFSGTAQLDMVQGGTFPGISNLSLPAGTYSQVRITFNNAFPVTGTLSHNGTAYYTTSTAFGGQTHLFSASTNTVGSMSEFSFYEPAWGALNADVIQTSSITPITVGPSTDYQPTLRFTISTTFHLKESTGTPSVYFTLGVPPVNLVAP